MSKLSDNYRTPPELFNALNEVTPFFWDACCDKDNCLVLEQQKLMVTLYDYLSLNILGMYSALGNDILPSTPYKHAIFMNPPYSNPLPFIKKAWEDSKHFRVVMLVKADMSTDWFNYILDTGFPLVTHLNQYTIEGIGRAYLRIIRTLDEDPYRSKVGILHLRKRVKFLADEEMFMADKGCLLEIKPDVFIAPNHYITAEEFTNDGRKVVETKNFKRGADGLIYPKRGPTFPSMILVLDRRSST